VVNDRKVLGLSKLKVARTYCPPLRHSGGRFKSLKRVTRLNLSHDGPKPPSQQRKKNQLKKRLPHSYSADSTPGHHEDAILCPAETRKRIPRKAAFSHDDDPSMK